MIVSRWELFNRLYPLIFSGFIRYLRMSHSSTVFVRQFEQENSMKISFMYGSSELPRQNFSFLRSKTEILEAALIRMKSKIHVAMLQKVSKKKKKVIDADQVLPSLDIVLLKNGVKLDFNTKNIDAWTSDTEVIINEESYQVVVNPPCVISINLPKSIISNFPVYPKVTLEFCLKEESVFKWFRKLSKSDSVIQDDDNFRKVNNNYWKLIGEGFCYIAQEADVGCKLMISCIPQSEGKSGKEEVAISINTVSTGPGTCPFEDRHYYTKEVTELGKFRVVSYNILADLYADTDVARQQLFPYCPSEFLDLDYRKHLYLKEIMGYNGDIVCLQEVDRKVFFDDLVPLLSSVSLQGVFNEKGGQVAEGLACFYRDSKFKLIESHSIILSEALKSESVLQNLYSIISENEKLKERFMTRTTALQVTLLQSIDAPEKQILVGNTHLYFHPDSDNIRLLQASTCLLYLENVLRKYQQDSLHSVSLLFCGDFNSCPEFGVYKLVSEGFLSGSCIDWKSNAEEAVDGIDLSHTLQLSSSCGTPQYTNFTQGFNGCLDYTFYDKSSLEVTQVVPFPSHEQVTQHIALPNKVFPSDHIALVSTLKWK